MTFERPIRMSRLDQLVAYIHAYFSATGTVPSYSMIAAELGIAEDDKGTVRRYVVQGEQAGYWTRDGEHRGGRGPRRGTRIRLGTIEELQRVTIKMGREV